MSLRDTILAADDIASETVDVPEWGVKVTLRGMTGKQRIQLVDKASATEKGYMYSDILIEMAYDEDGGQIFDPADREALADKSGGVLERLALKVLQLSGVSVDDAEDEVAEDPTSGGS